MGPRAWARAALERKPWACFEELDGIQRFPPEQIVRYSKCGPFHLLRWVRKDVP